MPLHLIWSALGVVMCSQLFHHHAGLLLWLLVIAWGFVGGFYGYEAGRAEGRRGRRR